MGAKIKYNILDKERQKLLVRLKHLKNDFYLAGGTALALQIGHRKSIDFDYFTEKDFDNDKLFNSLEKIFCEYKIEQIQNEENTLTILISQKVKISFFKLSYGNLLPFIDNEYFNLMQKKEIATMKILALPRATYRDYVDLYFLLKEYTLAEIIGLAKRKHRNFDEAIYLKCLLSYDDVQITPIKFSKGFNVTKQIVFSFIEKKTIEFIKSETG